MTINWGKGGIRYLSFVSGREWNKEDFKFFEYVKTPLGWSMNIHRLAISYDDYRRVKPRR